MSEEYPYNYDGQFSTYIAQFMRILSGFQVQKNVEGDLERVPVVYGNMDRVVSSIIRSGSGDSRNSKTFVNQKIPIIACSLDSIERDNERKRMPDYQNARMLSKKDGEFEVVNRIIGPPFLLNMSVSILASGSDQLFEILEQILLIFNPRVTIQRSDDVLDQNYLTEVTLENISNELEYPLGTSTRTVQMTLGFSFPIRLNYPKTFDQDYIEKIISKVASVGGGDDMFEIDGVD